jgi:small subunit ribosomal protein S9
VSEAENPEEPRPGEDAVPTPQDAEETAPEAAGQSETAPEAAETPAPETADTPAPETADTPAPEAAETPAPEAAETAGPAAAAPEVAETPAAQADAPEVTEAPAPQAAEAQSPPETPAAPTAAAPQPDAEADDEDVAPRQKPEIPGADLIPDIVTEGQEFLDAEALAAAEAEAEAAAAREQEPEDDSKPIADAAIDLAAGARYTATGKRKTAVARVILKPGTGTYSINGRSLDEFFPRETLQRMIRQPLETVGYESRMDVVARMHGGGVAAQGGALRHGISRALLEADPNLRGELKRRGFLTRDPRVKERKKAGLKKARKRPQFSKR